MNEKRHKDITGMRFGSLVAIDHAYTEKMESGTYYRYYRVYWNFRCDCSKRIVKATTNVSNGIGTSCRACMTIKRKEINKITAEAKKAKNQHGL